MSKKTFDRKTRHDNLSELNTVFEMAKETKEAISVVTEKPSIKNVKVAKEDILKENKL